MIEDFIQIDAATNSRNSNGTLINAKGELIGINTAIIFHTRWFPKYQICNTHRSGRIGEARAFVTGVFNNSPAAKGSES